MRDRIEKFIIENRERFDSEIPRTSIWDKISFRLGVSQPRKKRDFTFLWKAAAILFFGVTAYLLGTKSVNETQSRKIGEVVVEEFSDIENYYINQINYKIEQIESYSDLDNKKQKRTQFNENLGKLDAMYRVLKDKLEDDPSQEVVDALVLNLIMRIDMLNQKLGQLEEFSDINDDKLSI